ncbi:MAG: PAS domain S-box protein, partial [Dehalococcoidia bacterium]
MAGKSKVVIDKSYLRARNVSRRKRAGERLQESEEHFRALIENSSDAISILNGDGTIRYESPSVERVLGYKPEALIGRNVLEFLHPDDVQSVANTFDTSIKNPGQPVQMEVRFLHKDGSWRLMEGIGSNLLDDPKVNGIVVNYRDVTERKRMEEALQQREQDYLALLETTFEGIVVVDAETLKVVYGNRRASKMFGFDPVLKDGVGVDIFDFVHPEDKEVVIKGFTEDLYQEERRQKYEVRAKTKDGKELWITALGTRTEFQGRLAVLLSTIDVTERKKAEEALRESEERLRALIENAPEAITAYDFDGTVTDTNKKAEELLGYSREEMVGKNVFELGVIPDDYLPRTTEALAKSADGVEAQPFEFELVRKDGSRIIVEARTLAAKRGGKLEVICIVRDITERKQMEEELQIKANAVENSLSAVAMCDMEGKITYVNQACMRLWGWDKKEEILGQPYWVLLEPDEVVRDIARTMIERQTWEGELVGRRRDGKEVQIHVFSGIVNDDNGHPVQTISSFTDITERKGAEEALRESEEKFRRLVEEMNDGYC